MAKTSYPDLNNIVTDVAELLRPSERLTVSQAAEKYRILNNPGSYVGPWKNGTTPYLTEPMDVLGSREYTACVFVGPAQTGKGLALDTPIATPTGWSDMGDLKVGDMVFDENGNPTKVVFVSEIHHRPCFEVEFDNGEVITTDDYHKWLVEDMDKKDPIVMTTPEIESGFRVPSACKRGRGPRYAVRAAKTLKPSKTDRHFITDVRRIESVPTVCIQVDSPSHLFLAGRTMIPTHNTDALLLNWVTYNVICDPADMILYQTSQATARDFSKRRIDRLHRHTTPVGNLLQDRRDADNAYDKHYKSGIMLTLSWPSINEMSGRPVGRVALTDYDRMPTDIDGEGSPFDLARKRTTTFRSFAMTLAESSPGHTVLDPKWIRATAHEAPPCEGILSLYNRGDRRRWVWPCPLCEEYFEGEFSMLEWPDTIDVEEAGEGAKMRCPCCNELISPDHKAKMNSKGVWIKEGQKVKKDGTVVGRGQKSSMASFWMKGVAASFASWKNLVVNYINAEREFERTGSQEALKSTVNTDQGDAFVPKGLESLRTPEELKSRASEWPEQYVPEGVRFLVATVDVQKNMWVVQVTGFGPHGDEYIIDRFDIRKSKRKDDDNDTLWVKPGVYLEDWDLIEEQVLDKTYPLDDNSGRVMGIKMVGCDSGGREGVTQKAYEFWRKLRREGKHHRFRLLKGEATPGAPRVRVSYPDSQRKDRTAGARGEIPVLMMNVNILKDHLSNKLERRDDDGGKVNFPTWLPDHFFQELTAEIRTPKGWENPRGARNEAWDLLVYAEALWLHLGCERMDWDKPDTWAREWDDNDLIFGGKENTEKLKEQPKKVYDLASLAEALA